MTKTCDYCMAVRNIWQEIPDDQTFCRDCTDLLQRVLAVWPEEEIPMQTGQGTTMKFKVCPFCAMFGRPPKVMVPPSEVEYVLCEDHKQLIEKFAAPWVESVDPLPPVFMLIRMSQYAPALEGAEADGIGGETTYQGHLQERFTPLGITILKTIISDMPSSWDALRTAVEEAFAAYDREMKG